MWEAIVTKFSTLALFLGTDGIATMIADASNILYFTAIALIFVAFTARIVRGRYRSFFTSLARGRRFTNDRAYDRMFERRQIVALKKCPNCTEQLPLSAVLCDGCDYNFLSEMVGHGQKLLPSPEVLAQEMTAQRYEYRA
jgi:uncharacterized membrane protein YtjA (UPF0391 family)